MSADHTETIRTPAQLTRPDVLICLSDKDSETVAAASLRDLNVKNVIIKSGTIETAIEIVTTQPTPKLLIVDIEKITDYHERIERLSERCEPNTKVIIIGNQNDVALYRHLKNQGITDYFFKPLSPDIFKRACSAAIEPGEKAVSEIRKGKIIYIIGVKGQCGATTIAGYSALNLSHIRQSVVMYVDLDIQNGDTALQLNCQPNQALIEALTDPLRLDSLFLMRGKIRVTDRLDLLSSIVSLGTPLNIQEAAFNRLLEMLTEHYKYIFIEMPPHIASNFKNILEQPSICWLISDMSLTAARDVKRWLEFLGPNNAQRRTLQIVNMAGAEAAIPLEDFNQTVGRSPDIIIPYDKKIARNSSLGITTTFPSIALQGAVERILSDLAGQAVSHSPGFMERYFGMKARK